GGVCGLARADGAGGRGARGVSGPAGRGPARGAEAAGIPPCRARELRLLGGAMRGAGVTRRQVMVAAAAREIRDGEGVFVGMRLPLLGFALARALHAPNAVGLFENGVVRDTPPAGPIITMGDPPNIVGALACTTLLDVMRHLLRGPVARAFLGRSEVQSF